VGGSNGSQLILQPDPHPAHPSPSHAHTYRVLQKCNRRSILRIDDHDGLDHNISRRVQRWLTAHSVWGIEEKRNDVGKCRNKKEIGHFDKHILFRRLVNVTNERASLTQHRLQQTILGSSLHVSELLMNGVELLIFVGFELFPCIVNAHPSNVLRTKTTVSTE